MEEIKEMLAKEDALLDALGRGDLDESRELFLEWQKLRADLLMYLLTEVCEHEKKGKMTAQQFAKEKGINMDRPADVYNLDKQ